MAKPRGSVRMGPISIFALIIILCLAVLAVLSVTSARAELSITERQAATTSETYQLDAAAQELVADIDGALSTHRSVSVAEDGTVTVRSSATPAQLIALVDDAVTQFVSTDRYAEASGAGAADAAPSEGDATNSSEAASSSAAADSADAAGAGAADAAANGADAAGAGAAGAGAAAEESIADEELSEGNAQKLEANSHRVMFPWGQATVITAREGNLVSVTFSVESGRTLAVTLRINDNATCTVEEWKTTTQWTNEAPGDNLWLG